MHERVKERRETLQLNRWAELKGIVQLTTKTVAGLSEVQDGISANKVHALHRAILEVQNEMGAEYSVERLARVVHMVSRLAPRLAELSIEFKSFAQQVSCMLAQPVRGHLARKVSGRVTVAIEAGDLAEWH